MNRLKRDWELTYLAMFCFKICLSCYCFLLTVLSFPCNCNNVNQCNNMKVQFVFLWAIPGLFLVYFCIFKQTLEQTNVKKCQSSLQCWDLNPHPSQSESPPVTTRPSYICLLHATDKLSKLFNSAKLFGWFSNNFILWWISKSNHHRSGHNATSCNLC